MTKQEVHIQANLIPEANHYVVAFTGRDRVVKRTMAPDDFRHFVETEDEFWSGSVLSLVGDDGSRMSITMDKIQRARIREYMELVLGSDL